MKKLLAMLIICLVTLLAGCTIAETSEQRNRRLTHITNRQMRMLIEDWDYVWLYDRSTKLSPWHAGFDIYEEK